MVIRRRRVPARRRVVRRPTVARRPMMRRRRVAARNRVNDVAGVSESIVFFGRNALPVPPVSNFVGTDPAVPTSLTYFNSDISLASFTRAPLVAQGYQRFKIKYFELQIKPDADTFAPGAASGKPYFYYMIDKSNSLSVALTTGQLKSLGAKAIALDEKVITIRWKPAVTLSTEIATATGTTSAQMYKVSPILNTDEDPGGGAFQPSQVVHNGIRFMVENAGAPVNYRATLTAHFQFYKPSIPAIATTAPEST